MIRACICSARQLEDCMHEMPENLLLAIRDSTRHQLLEASRRRNGLPDEDYTGAVVVRPGKRYGEWALSAIPKNQTETFYVTNEMRHKEHATMIISSVYEPDQVETEVDEDRHHWYRSPGEKPRAMIVGLTSDEGEKLISACVMASKYEALGRRIVTALTRPVGLSPEVRRLLGR